MLDYAEAGGRSFRDLWEDYSLGIVAFAQVAGVEPQIVKDMLYNQSVPPLEAQKVLVKVSEILKRRYIAEDIIAIPRERSP